MDDYPFLTTTIHPLCTATSHYFSLTGLFTTQAIGVLLIIQYVIHKLPITHIHIPILMHLKASQNKTISTRELQNF